MPCSKEERITREVIETLMCNYRIDWLDLADHLHCPPSELRQSVGYNEAAMREFSE
jgi:oxygen-independent coproporphyrinogen-3 oxidase